MRLLGLYEKCGEGWLADLEWFFFLRVASMKEFIFQIKG